MFALIFAPGFGGGLSEFGLSTPFFVSAALAILGGIFAIIYLKESMPNTKPICSRKTTDMAMEDVAASEMTTRESSTKVCKENEPKNNSTVSAAELEAAAIKSEEEALVHRTMKVQGTILNLLFVCGALVNLYVISYHHALYFSRYILQLISRLHESFCRIFDATQK